jgi:hypothetical protein
MRNLLILSFTALAAIGAAGCGMGRNPCGGSSGGWYPGQHLFGSRNQVQAAPVCCDPCAGGGAMMGAPVMSAPVMATEACCQ